ncbi:XdhC family protein [Actinocrispum sp. NPDC049592]|uniref:XdhC family protein n=1 Tax=Actinocrispum sp. NPDC049592 TaxID=3154835 RepID=UPI00342F7F76
MHMLDRAEGLREGRTPYVLATVVRAERPTSAKPGDRALVLSDGSMEGFVGGDCAESTVRAQGMRLLRTGESTLLRITPTATAETTTEGLVTVGNPCLSGGSLDIFLEAVLPPLLIHIHGDAPIARALRTVGKALGHDVRPSGPLLPEDLAAVVVASHGKDEAPILLSAVRSGVPYIGLVASQKRGQAVLNSLDLSPTDRLRIHTPAGLNIGAHTPSEIALSIYAELLSLRPHPTPTPTPTAPETTTHTCHHD